jgi:hypothetical protein
MGFSIDVPALMLNNNSVIYCKREQSALFEPPPGPPRWGRELKENADYARLEYSFKDKDFGCVIGQGCTRKVQNKLFNHITHANK